jgi:hypothetical protein
MEGRVVYDDAKARVGDFRVGDDGLGFDLGFDLFLFCSERTHTL